jgi:threonine dehydratase
MAKSLAAGKIETLGAITSIARSLSAAARSEQTLALAQQFLEKVIALPDSEAASASLFLLESLKVLTEPASSCTLAAADCLRGEFAPERHVVLVLSGGNFAMEDLAKLQTA